VAGLFLTLLYVIVALLIHIHIDFEVKDSLTNVTFSVGSGRSFAGKIGVQRDGHPNNSLVRV
jgi:hypothetical protein